MRLLRQHVKDWINCKRHGILTPALWETRHWLALVDGKPIPKSVARKLGMGPKGNPSGTRSNER